MQRWHGAYALAGADRMDALHHDALAALGPDVMDTVRSS